VSAIDVILGIGWLGTDAHARWRKGQVPYLERVVHANLKRISTALYLFRKWAAEQGLKPSETHYKHRSHTLRFSKSKKHSVERLYRTHSVSPTRSKMKVERRQKEPCVEESIPASTPERCTNPRPMVDDSGATAMQASSATSSHVCHRLMT
jgi:hypothetical protein